MSFLSEARNKIGKAKGYSGCYRCHGTWDYTKSHITRFSNNEGCFPLCETCWQELTPTERLPYYDRLVSDWPSTTPVGIEHWEAETRAKWPLIRAAVLDGK